MAMGAGWAMDGLKRHFLLDPAVTFLNHGSYGACPRPVFAAYQRWQRGLERQPVAFIDPSRDFGPAMLAARQALAAEVGAQADDLVGVVNATTGLNIVAQSLALVPGDEILMSDHEYSALEKTWAHVAARSGARTRVARVPLPLTDAASFTNVLTAAMTSRTKVLFLSHITSATALHFPIGPLVAIARQRGIISVIDGAHAPGQVALHLDQLGADAYVGNCHKWLMAPKGAAFLHVRRDLQPQIAPLVISHGWTPKASEPGPFGNSAFVDRLEVQGTRDPAAFLAVPAAIQFRARHRWDPVARRCHDLMAETAQRIAALTGLPPLSTPDFGAPQMIALPLPACDPAALQKALLTRHAIEVPCYHWQGRPILRLSVQGYNEPTEMDRLIRALSTELRLPSETR